MKIKKILGSVLLAGFAVCVFASPSEAKRALAPKPKLEAVKEATVVLADASPLSANEMGTLRGGFIDPTGLIYRFGVNIQTALNGAEIFTRSFTVSPATPGGPMQASTNASLAPQNVPSGMSISMIGNGRGVSVTDANGLTSTILNQAAGGAPSSIVMNTANDRSIAQTINMTLTLQSAPAVAAMARAAVQGALLQQMQMRSIGF